MHHLILRRTFWSSIIPIFPERPLLRLSFLLLYPPSLTRHCGSVNNHRPGMTSSKHSDIPSPAPPPDSFYHPLPNDPYFQSQPQPYYVVVLPRYYNPYSYYCRLFRRLAICLAFLLLFAGAVFLLWPSDPDVSIVRLHLHRFRIRTFPIISLDVNLQLTVKIRNKDFYSLDYDSLTVSIGYRGKQLGLVRSNHEHVRARGSSYVNASLALSGVEILADVIPLLEDVRRGEISFDTVSEVDGQLGLFFVKLPIEVRNFRLNLI